MTQPAQRERRFVDATFTLETQLVYRLAAYAEASGLTMNQALHTAVDYFFRTHKRMHAQQPVQEQLVDILENEAR